MLERLIHFSIRHRWLMLVLTAALIALGVWSYRQLSIDATPDITNVQVQINTQAPGYSPLEAEQRVTFPIETAMAGLPQLDYSRSLSRYGLSQVTVVFKDGTDLYFARQQVAERLQQITSQLPEGLDPEMGPISTGLGEIFMYTVEAEPDARKPDGSPYTATDLRTLQDWVIRPQLRTTPGVTEVNTIGGFERQIHITPDPAQLVALGFTLQDVVGAVMRNNQNVGAGYIERNGQQFLVRVPGQLRDVDAVGSIVLDRRDGVPIRVRDVATVGEGKELRTGAATQNGHEVVVGTAFMLFGANSRDVSRAAVASAAAAWRGRGRLLADQICRRAFGPRRGRRIGRPEAAQHHPPDAQHDRHDLRPQHRMDVAAQPRNARTAHEPCGRKCAEGLHLPARSSEGRGARLSRLHSGCAPEGHL